MSAMLPLVKAELFKTFRRPRTYISFAIVASIALLIELAMLADGHSFIDFILQGVNEDFDISGKVLNGYLVTYMILGLLLVHVPLLVALVAGDAVAGEAAAGTLRLLLTRPVTRPQLILSKFFASCIYSLLLLAFLAIIGLGLSLLFFGKGDMFNLTSDRLILLLRDDMLWRYCCAFGFACLAMFTVAALSILLSVLAGNPIGPIVGTMGVIIFLTIITNLDIPLFALIRPWLFSSHMIGWKGFFDDPVPYRAISFSALVLVGYIVLLLGTAIIIFKRKDIHS